MLKERQTVNPVQTAPSDLGQHCLPRLVCLNIELPHDKTNKSVQALHDTLPLGLFLLRHMIWHKKYQCNYQIWSNPPIISQDIEHKHNSKINQGS